jgi:hypothetical protein
LFSILKKKKDWNIYFVQLSFGPDWRGVLEWFFSEPKVYHSPRLLNESVLDVVSYANGLKGSLSIDLKGLEANPDEGVSLFFPPEIALHLVKLACERPDKLGISLSQWNCPDLAHQLITEGIVQNISVATVQRILSSHKLKPWRHHMWLYPKEQ